MTYYEQLLKQKGIQLTNEQQSTRNAWFVSQDDQTRHYRPFKDKEEIQVQLDDPTLKLCSSCEDIKPATEFHKDKNRPDGRDPRCKECKLRKALRYR